VSKVHFKIKNGARIVAVTSDPTDAEEGDIIFRSDLTPARFRVYRNSAWADLNDSSYNRLDVSDDSTTGSNATIATPASPFIRLTGALLTSVDGIPAGEDGQTIMVTNVTGSLVIFNDQTGTAANQIVTGTLKPIKLKSGGTILLTYDATSQKWRAISGAGGGEGNADAYLESLKNQFQDTYFNLLTPNIFRTDELTKLDVASTGSYNYADETYDLDAAEQMISINMLDPNEFFSSSGSLEEVELSVYWRLANVDTAATYEVSRDGGNEWQTISMERVGSTDLYRGYHRFSEETVDQEIYNPGLDSGVLTFNNTTVQSVSQEFTLSGKKSIARSIKLKGLKIGTPTGNLYVAIHADNAGVPGEQLVKSGPKPITDLPPSTSAYFTMDIPSVYLLDGVKYHVVVTTDDTYKINYNGSTAFFQLKLTTSTGVIPYIDIYDGTSWTTFNDYKLHSIVQGIDLDLRVKIAASNSSKLEGYGIFYDKELSAGVASSSLNIEVFEFSGNSNTYEFTLTKFVPHPDLLKVYDVNTGQVYDYGAFSFSGQKVVFESGQFYQPGQTIKLRFIQMEGSAFDNSDVNALLMASNHLGSTDANIDRSVAGRGIFLRRPDGTLREICIDNSDNIIIYSV